MSRRAFTLLETVLVLSLLVILAAMAWPALKGPMSGHRLRRSADQVRAEWARARNRAMLSGEIQAFVYLPGSDRFRVVAYADAQGTLQQAAAGSNTAGSDTPGSGTTASGTAAGDRFLPAGVVFAASTISAAAAQAAFGAQGSWSDMILFYPDGTSTKATVTHESEDGRQVPVELRGVTGGSRAGEMISAQEVGR
ncbi:MAG: prepilin-type N-terminal cleavage/methylation domain-containing protein [Pirellulales bacterium]